MPELILTEFVEEIKEKVSLLSDKLKKCLDFSEVEKEISNSCNKLMAGIIAEIMNELFSCKEFMAKLKMAAVRNCLKYKEHRKITLSLVNGKTIKVNSPYFLSSKIKAKKKGPNGLGSHFGLEVLGILEHCSPDYLSNVVEMGLLCPSLAVAKEVLARRGVNIDVKRLRRLCKVLGETGLRHRGEISLSEQEQLNGKTLVIGIDGGRIRQRVRKKEKKPEQKRHGYHSDWKEPKLFTIYLLDEAGKPVKDFAPLHDATMENYQIMFAILEHYLMALNPECIENIVFTSDGDPTLWQNIEKLLDEMNFSNKIYQVLDYPHAKQNLNQIVELVPANERTSFEKQAKELLWNGNILGIAELIKTTIKSKGRRGNALKKWRNYFQKNEARMQYTHFKELNLPCGSGCVESAIRRVINLRLKSAGSFWTKDMAECFLFLRSQLISGRWNIFMKNVSNLKKKFALPLMKSSSPEIYQKSDKVLNRNFEKQEEIVANAA